MASCGCIALMLIGLCLGATIAQQLPPLREYVVPGTPAYTALVSFTPTSNCVLAPGVSALMSEKLKNDLEDTCYLSKVAYGDGVKITITQGYITVTQQDIAVKNMSLRFGARSLTLEGVKVNGGAYNFADDVKDWDTFDEIQVINGNTVSVSVLPDLCYNKRPIDLAFLLDGSGSITQQDWIESRNFVKNVSGFFDIAVDKTRVAVAMFSSDRSDAPTTSTAPRCVSPDFEHWTSGAFANWVTTDNPGCICVRNNSQCIAPDGESCSDLTVQVTGQGTVGKGILVTHIYPAFWGALPNGSSRCVGGVKNNDFFGGGTQDHGKTVLNFTSSNEVLNQTLNELEQPYGYTRTSLGLAEVRNVIMTEEGGMRGSAIPKVLIVLTDGASSRGFEPETEAKLLHNLGITVIAVGVGGYDQDELEDIASNEENVLTVSDFSQLKDLTTRIDTLTCGACIATNWSTPVNLTLAPGEYQCLQPSCGSIPTGSLVNVASFSGLAVPYISDSQYGGPLNYELADTSDNTAKALKIDSIQNPYVIVKGVASGITQVLFATSAVQASINADAGKNALVVDFNAQFGSRTWTVVDTPVPDMFTLSTSGQLRVNSKLGGPAQYTLKLNAAGGCGAQVTLIITVTSASPTRAPSKVPTRKPTQSPVRSTTQAPTQNGDTKSPSTSPTKNPVRSPTTPPSASPSPMPTPPTPPPFAIVVECDATGKQCLSGRGTCAYDGNDFFCSCGAGLVPPQCGPGSPSFAQPSIDPVKVNTAMGTPIGSVYAEVERGVVSYSLSNQATYTGPGNNQRRHGRDTTSVQLATPFFVDPSTGMLSVSMVLPGPGVLMVPVFATASFEGLQNTSSEVLVIDLEAVTTSPSSAPSVPVIIPTVVAPTAPPVVPVASGAKDRNAVSTGGVAAIIMVFLLLLFIVLFFLFRRHKKNQKEHKEPGFENPAYVTHRAAHSIHERPISGVGRDGMVANALYQPVGAGSEPLYEGVSDSTYQVPLNPGQGAVVNTTYGDVGRKGLMTNGTYGAVEGANNDEAYMDCVPKPEQLPTSADDNLYQDALGQTPQYDSMTILQPRDQSDDQLYDVAATHQPSQNQQLYDVAGNENYLEMDTKPATSSKNEYLEVTAEENTVVAQNSHNGGDDEYLYGVATNTNADGSSNNRVYDSAVQETGYADLTGSGNPTNGEYLYDTAAQGTGYADLTGKGNPSSDDNLYDTAGITDGNVPQDGIYDIASTHGATQEVSEPLYDTAMQRPVPVPRKISQPTPQETTTLPLPAGWVETKDDKGNTYFYNSATQESSWDRPADVEVVKRKASARPGNKYWVESVYLTDNAAEVEDDV